jgi:toxin-antitoxin system PIN domain toxin
LNASARLFDTNVWLALSFARHPCHAEAVAVFSAADSSQPAAFCRATQQSYLRLLTTPAIQTTYGSTLITNEAAWIKSQDLLALPQVIRLAEPAGLETEWKRAAGLPSASPKVWMDAYLAAFAITAGVEFVTADRDYRRFEPDGLKLIFLTP